MCGLCVNCELWVVCGFVCRGEWVWGTVIHLQCFDSNNINYIHTFYIESIILLNSYKED